MNILLIDTGSYMTGDILLTLRNTEHDVSDIFFSFKGKDKYNNPEFEQLFENTLNQNKKFDVCFSTLIYPVIARLCFEHNIPYVVWSYDSPINLQTTEGLDYPTNHFYLFDRNEAARWNSKGFSCFKHLPLAVNANRLKQVCKYDPDFSCDVSMMGKLYRSTLPYLKNHMDKYCQGFIDGLINSQLNLYGSFLIDNALTDDIINKINDSLQKNNSNFINVTKAQLSYSISTQITYIERISILRLLSSKCSTHLYTYTTSADEQALLKNVSIHGPIDYGFQMPNLFFSSKINLNATLKDIQSGICLRALDILGCGGFLLTNYQEEIAEHFVNEKEVVMYESIEDAVAKAEFYLKHDDLREKIALAGQERAASDFRFEDRIKVLFSEL